MFKQKKVIIFDMDGTLIDSIGIWNAVDSELIAQLSGLDEDETFIQERRDALLHSFSHTSDAYLEYCDFLSKNYRTPFSKEQIRAMRYDIAERYLKEVVDFKPHAHTFLHYLKAQGLHLVIASTTSQNNLAIYQTQNHAMMQKVNFAKTFSLILGREAVTKIKPHPEVHQHIMKTLNVTPQECLIVEDSLVGMEAAHNAGIDAIVMYDRYAKADEMVLKERSLGYFEDFKTLQLYVEEQWEKS